MSARIMQQSSYQQFLDETTWDRPEPISERARDIRAKIAPPPGSGKKLKYKTGQRVRHAKFGEGMVIESQAKSGDEEVTVSFSNKQHGIKRLAASFANLEIMDN